MEIKEAGTARTAIVRAVESESPRVIRGSAIGFVVPGDSETDSHVTESARHVHVPHVTVGEGRVIGREQRRPLVSRYASERGLRSGKQCQSRFCRRERCGYAIRSGSPASPHGGEGHADVRIEYRVRIAYRIERRGIESRSGCPVGGAVGETRIVRETHEERPSASVRGHVAISLIGRIAGSSVRIDEVRSASRLSLVYLRGYGVPVSVAIRGIRAVRPIAPCGIVAYDGDGKIVQRSHRQFVYEGSGRARSDARVFHESVD